MADAASKSTPPPSPPRDDDVAERRTLRDYYIILRERLWIALPLAVLVAVGYGYRKMQQTPTYAAHATMKFEKPESIVDIRNVTDQHISSDVDLNTYMIELNSQRLREKVLASFSPAELDILRRAAMKRRAPGAPIPGPDLGSVTPYSTRNSYVIDINVVHEDPEAAALVANHYVSSFMDYLMQSASGVNEDAVRFLQAQAEVLRKESEQKESDLQDYMRQHTLGISLDSTQNLVADALRRATSARDEARLALLRLDDKVNQIESYQEAHKNIFEIADIAERPAVAQLRSQLSSLQQQQLVLSDKYLERHPAMIELANNIAITQAALDKAVAGVVAEFKARQAEARQTLKTAEAEFDKARQNSLDLNALAVEFGSKKSAAEIAKSNYEAILKRLNDTKTIKKIENVPVHPLDRATPNYSPIAPNKSEIIKTSVGLGVLVFLGVAIGLSFIDDRVKSAWDVESFIGANLLGIIPDLASMKDDEKYTLLLDNQQTLGSESFLSVYSAIKIHSKLDFPKSVLVTSTIPGEGKTLISCNIAGAFARHGKRTLLVDCDLRRPMLHRHFKQQNNAGLLPWFEAGAPMEGDFATNPALGIIKVSENLSLLCSGGRSKSPTELLENPLFGQLLERLKREYDLVIVDSPPMGAVTDSLLIAERIDEVVYVCRFNRAYRKHIRLYMRALRSGKNEVLGVVLNGLSPRRIEYYSNYRYYRSYKKYYGAQT